MTSLVRKCERTFEFAAIQLRHLIETCPDRFPMYTEKGKWVHGGEAWTNWCEGFMGGQLWRIARQHCLTSRRYLVRGDGSIAHKGIFDTDTGEFLRESTHQGWRGDSSWARGLAWALYGFGTAYQFSKDVHLLNTAEACAAYYIENTPSHGVPPNDWLEPDPAFPHESSAAAIAASGLFNLAGLTQDPVRARFYADYARRIVDTLTEPEFLAVDTPGWEGILRQGIYHTAKGLGVDESVMWGDYYFLEAVGKVLG